MDDLTTAVERCLLGCYIMVCAFTLCVMFWYNDIFLTLFSDATTTVIQIRINSYQANCTKYKYIYNDTANVTHCHPESNPELGDVHLFG